MRGADVDVVSESRAGLDSAGLGRLSRVAQARDVWPTEAAHFTPWLADNLDVLADQLGLSLTLVATEVPVGEFRLDVQAQTADGRVVIVENQLERTDNGHLGQVLVYASGLEAAIVVWVAPSFREDHRRTLDWLNGRTEEGLSFFAVEVGIVQIGDGPRAPVFDVVARPNDWQKHVRASAVAAARAEVTPLNEQRQDYFQDVITRLAAGRPGIRVPARSNANWSSFASGPFGYWALSVTADRQVRLEAYLDCGDRARNKALFDDVRESVMPPTGLDLRWERLDDKRASRIACYYYDAPPYTGPARAAAIEWAVSTFLPLYDAYNDVLRTKARQLRVQPPVAEVAVVESPSEE